MDFPTAKPYDFGSAVNSMSQMAGAASRNNLAQAQLSEHERAGQFRAAAAKGDLPAMMQIDPQAANEYQLQMASLMEANRKEGEARAGAINQQLSHFTPEVRNNPAKLREMAPIVLENLQELGEFMDVEINEDTSPERINEFLSSVPFHLADEMAVPKWTGGQAAVDEQGNPVFMQSEPGGGVRSIPGYSPPPANEFRTEVDPDGNVTTTWGKPTAGGGGMQKPTAKALEEKILTNTGSLDRLARIGDTFDEEYLTYGGVAKGFVYSKMDKVNPDTLSADEKKWLGNYTSWRMNAMNELNLGIKNMTGAQMSALEADRLRKGMLDAENDSPTVFKAKYDETVRSLQLSRVRAYYYLDNGMTPPKGANEEWSISLGQMDEMIRADVEKLKEGFYADHGDMAKAERDAWREAGKRYKLD